MKRRRHRFVRRGEGEMEGESGYEEGVDLYNGGIRSREKARV